MFADKTMETGASAGTSDLTLGTSVSGWKTWRSQKADTTVVPYFAEIADGSIWEVGYGTLTYGSPDKITGRVLMLSSTGSLVNFASATVYVMSIPNAAILNHLIGGGGAAARPGWLPIGGRWRDDSAGLGTRAIDYIKTGSGASANSETGRLDGASGIYVASNAAPIRDTTTSGSTIGINDRGYIVNHDTTAAVRVAALPAVATATAGFYVGIYADGIFPVRITTNSGEAIDNSVVPPGQVVWVRCTGAKWLTQGSATQALIGRRQTVTTGPLSSGAPSFLATASGLNLATQNIAAATPLIVRASNGAVDRWGLSAGNLTFSSLTDATTNYLYVTVGVDGPLTAGKTTLAPIYQESGTPATTNGQFTFNYGEMKGYLGNGSSAPQAYVAFIGEATTSGGNITAVTAYAYNGRYDSGYTATLPAGGIGVTKNHNIGCLPLAFEFRAHCTTTDAGWAVGDEISTKNMTGYNGASDTVPVIGSGTKAMTAQTSGNPFYVLHKSTGAVTALTLASWKYRMTADRGWG
ncbi:MAG: hypothetical protein K2Y40_13640 [Reyranella sp.]|nr:hypothetical protein [Reyranella sp.]